jgi:hypothetical protein
VLDGVKVAVITEVPTPAAVSVVPETEITEVVAEEYENVPATDPTTTGAVTVKVSEYDRVTLLQLLNVGVALLKVKVAVVVAASKFADAAFVIVKVQLPDVEAESVEPLQVHPVAVPSTTEVIESAPSPLPPVTEVTVNDVCEYGKVLLEALKTGEEMFV